MPIFRPPLITNEIYHIYNRGVNKQIIYPNESDYFRFIHDLWEFNDKNKTLNTTFYLNPAHYRETFSIIKGIEVERQPREPIVEILAYCLIPNHFHLLLRQLVENGISLFMRKLGGYSLYINKKYNRVGPLLQGRFKAIHIRTEAQLFVIVNYIHLNCLDLEIPYWKEKEFDLKKAIQFLENYRFSSYPDYIGKKNFSSVINKKFLEENIGKSEKFKQFTKEILSNRTKFDKFLKKARDLALEI